MNKWKLTDDVKEEFTPIIEDFIEKVESAESETEARQLSIDLSHTKLSPFTLITLLENLDYENVDQDSNGWQLDYWITMSKNGFKTLIISGTAIIFELNLRVK